MIGFIRSLALIGVLASDLASAGVFTWISGNILGRYTGYVLPYDQGNSDRWHLQNVVGQTNVLNELGLDGRSQRFPFRISDPIAALRDSIFAVGEIYNSESYGNATGLFKNELMNSHEKIMQNPEYQRHLQEGGLVVFSFRVRSSGEKSEEVSFRWKKLSEREFAERFL